MTNTYEKYREQLLENKNFREAYNKEALIHDIAVKMREIKEQNLVKLLDNI